MKKVFISHPLRALSEDEIEARRDFIKSLIRSCFEREGDKEDFEVIDTCFKDFDGNRLQFLGKSVMEGLAKADMAVFAGEWEKYDGCRCEHFIAAQYGIKCLYVTFINEDGY